MKSLDREFEGKNLRSATIGYAEKLAVPLSLYDGPFDEAKIEGYLFAKRSHLCSFVNLGAVPDPDSNSFDAANDYRLPTDADVPDHSKLVSRAYLLYTMCFPLLGAGL